MGLNEVQRLTLCDITTHRLATVSSGPAFLEQSFYSHPKLKCLSEYIDEENGVLAGLGICLVKS